MFEASPPTRRFRPATAKELLMRFAPVSLALSVLAAVTASTGQSAPPQPMDARAAALEANGRKALALGDTTQATDAFEAALAVQPGADRLVLDLADAARRQGMQGKALHYYHVLLSRDPQSIEAIEGEGEALAEKGALEKAHASLTRLESVCGSMCAPSRRLSAAIAAAETKPAAPRVVSAGDVTNGPAREN